MMQRHDFAAERKTDARTLHVAVDGARRLHETLENMILLVARDAYARVAHGEGHTVLGVALSDDDLDFAARRGEFQRIGKQVVDDALDALRVDPHQDRAPRDGEKQLDSPLGRHFAEIVERILDHRHQVDARNLQLHLFLDNLAEVEQLVDKRQHPFGVAVGQRQAVFAARRELVVTLYVLDAAQYQRQRRPQFVRYVGKEAQFQVGHVLFDARGAAHAHHRSEDPQAYERDSERQQYVERLGPPR